MSVLVGMHSGGRTCVWMVVACVGLADASPALAQASASSGRAVVLDLATAVADALAHGAVLRASDDAVTLADLRQQDASAQFGVRVAPVLGATIGEDGEPRRRAGLDIGKRFRFGADLAITADLQQDPRQVFDQSASYSATLTQSVLQAFGPARTAALTQASRDVTAAQRQQAQARQQVVLDVARTFHAVVAQQRLVDAGEHALTRAHVLRASSDARTAVGLATRLDVLRAELLVSQAEAQLDNHRGVLADQLDHLKVLTGRALSTDLRVERSHLARREDIGDVGALIPEALRTRLDLAEARDRIRDAARSASVARWQLLPDIGVTASYAQRRYTGLPQTFTRQVFEGWQFGIVTTYRHDRAGRAGVAAAELGARSARLALDDLAQRVEADVRRAHRACVRADGAVTIQTRALDLARQQLRLAQLRYERGLADNFHVIDAEAAVFVAETALISAEGARDLAALELDLAVGRLSPASVTGGRR